MRPVELPYADRSSTNVGQRFGTATMPVPTAVPNDGNFLTAAFAAYLVRLSGTDTFDIALSLAALAEEIGEFNPYFATQVPFQVKVDGSAATADALAALQS